jgi:hypothetical protein
VGDLQSDCDLEYLKSAIAQRAIGYQIMFKYDLVFNAKLQNIFLPNVTPENIHYTIHAEYVKPDPAENTKQN